MFDNRLRLLQNNYEIPIFPNLNELWIWENKLRTLEFLKINKLPHPKSYIFYELDEIFDFPRNVITLLSTKLVVDLDLLV